VIRDPVLAFLLYKGPFILYGLLFFGSSFYSAFLFPHSVYTVGLLATFLFFSLYWLYYEGSKSKNSTMANAVAGLSAFLTFPFIISVTRWYSNVQ